MLLALLANLASAGDALLMDPPRGAVHPADVAVVVGNEDYAFLPDVPYALRDADAVYDTLVTTAGVLPERVWDLRGANREQMLDALDAAVAALGEEGTVWFYFAGHGAASPATTAPMLVGDDAKRDAQVFASRSLTIPEIEARVGDHALVLVTDACFTGAGRDGEVLVPGARFAVPAWVRGPDPHHLIVTAAGPDQVARPYDAAGHGLFTWLLLGGLQGWADGASGGGRDGQVTVAEAEAWVGKALRALQVDDQRPVWRGPKDGVLVRAEALAVAPDLTTMSRPGAATPVDPPPRTSSPTRSPWVPPYRHLRGSTWADAHGLAMPGAQVRMLASQDLEGQEAVRRMRTVPWAMSAAAAVGLEGLLVAAVMLPISASPTWADTPDDQRFYRNFGIGGLVVAGGMAGWELHLGRRLTRHRAAVAASARRNLERAE